MSGIGNFLTQLGNSGIGSGLPQGGSGRKHLIPNFLIENEEKVA